MARHLRSEPVLDALEMTVTQCCDVIHPSDQRSKYTSLAFGSRCQEASVRPSMGAVGDAYDNAMAESFFSTLECERVGRRRFRSQADARMACFSNIEGFCNPLCRHSDTARPSYYKQETQPDPFPEPLFSQAPDRPKKRGNPNPTDLAAFILS